MKETMDRWGLHNPNIFAAGIMEAAYTQCDEWIEQVNAYLDENYEFLKKYIEKNMPELESDSIRGYLYGIGCKQKSFRSVRRS